MKRPLVECIPNFSEGRRPEVIEAIVQAMRSAAGVHILDKTSDADHHRSVVTFVGTPDAVEAAMFAAIRQAAELIDMTQHKGEHPRLGATDVVPFVACRKHVVHAHRCEDRIDSNLELSACLEPLQLRLGAFHVVASEVLFVLVQPRMV